MPAFKKLEVSYTQFTLPNGLRVILHEDHSVPLVTVNVWCHVGSARERPGRTGFAHLFEHLMFMGSGHVKPGQFDEWLEAAGYGVRKAADGSAGLAAVKFAAPALVVTDIHMPGTSGATVILELKRQRPEIPVIAISCLFDSGHGMDADAAITLGAARALAKPFKRGELLRAVADLLGPPAG